MGQKSLFGAFCSKKEQLLSEIPKKPIAAAYCSIIAAYRPKVQHIGFFIESCIKWAKNNYLGHFLIGEGNYYSKYKKNPPLLHTAAHLQHTGQKCIILDFSLKIGSNGLKIIIWVIS